MSNRKPHKKETIRKIRETILKLGNTKYTPEIRRKMSEIKKRQYINGVKPWNKGKKDVYSEKTRKKMGSNRKMYGEKSHHWKGGRNPMWIRKLRIKENGGSHTLGEWENLKVQYNWTCPSCKKFDVVLTKDHIIPITKGGSDNIENIQPLCQSCNSRKHKQEVKY